MKTDLTRQDWLKAARLALLHGGAEAVRVEKLARTLQVTKGSFYWHFQDREELIEALLCDWEGQKQFLMALSDGSPKEALTKAFQQLSKNLKSSERGDTISDAAMFAWAAVDQVVAKRVKKEEAVRIRIVRQAFGDDEIAEFIYMAYVGYVTRRRRASISKKSFEILVNVSIDLLLERRGSNKQKLARPRRTRDSR